MTYVKKLFSIVVVFALVLGLCPVVNAETLSDEANTTITSDTTFEDVSEALEFSEALVVFEDNEYDKVPLYKQTDKRYKNIPYGNIYRKNGQKATIGSHGCGPTCLAMVATYLLDKEYTPADAAKDFGNYNTIGGSSWTLFRDSAKKLGLDLKKQTYSEKEVIKALKNGQVVISLQHKGLFTNGGHFVVLTRISKNGRIFVNDPNGLNYSKNKILRNGFKNGFTQKQIFENGGPYWIYGQKETNVFVIGPSFKSYNIDENTAANIIQEKMLNAQKK